MLLKNNHLKSTINLCVKKFSCTKLKSFYIELLSNVEEKENILKIVRK